MYLDLCQLIWWTGHCDSARKISMVGKLLTILLTVCGNALIKKSQQRNILKVSPVFLRPSCGAFTTTKEKNKERLLSQEVNVDAKRSFTYKERLTFTEFVVQCSESWLDILETYRRLLYLSTKFRHEKLRMIYCKRFERWGASDVRDTTLSSWFW